MMASVRGGHLGDLAQYDASWRGVITTGIYCRSTCGSRRPRADNIRRFSSAEDAEAAGFRPCRRCRPQEGTVSQRNAEMVVEACRMIEEDEHLPSVAALSHALGISEGHFHRLFRSATGMTPRAYAQQRRAAVMRDNLASRRRVTEIIYDSGFGSSSRFYAITQKSLGMTPSHYKAGGANETLRFALGQTSLGAILAASSERGVAAILMGDDPAALLRDLQDRFPNARLVGGDADYERVIAQVVGLVEDPSTATGLPLDLRGTAFQRRVWSALQKISAGSTASYDEIAKRIGHPRAANAVASACASNPLAVAIPCHRVVKADGSSFGYTWGLERKWALLEREASRSEDTLADVKERPRYPHPSPPIDA